MQTITIHDIDLAAMMIASLVREGITFTADVRANGTTITITGY